MMNDLFNLKMINVFHELKFFVLANIYNDNLLKSSYIFLKFFLIYSDPVNLRRVYITQYLNLNSYINIWNIFKKITMEPKKDFSTAILESKKAPNKLIVWFF